MTDPALNALDLITMDGLDRPSYIEDLDEVLLRNQERSLQELYDLHGTIGPDPNYDEEGNIIPQELWGPDLSFNPLMSKTSLAKIKNLFIGSPRKSALQTADILSKIERKLTPKLATKVAKGTSLKTWSGKEVPDTKTIFETLTPTKFSLFIENQTRKSLLRKLSTPEEYVRFKKTYPDAGELFEYDDYTTFLEMNLYPSKLQGVDKYTPHISKKMKKALGRYYPESGLIAMNPSSRELGLSGWRSTLRHELKHHLDFELTGYGSDDYERLKTVFDEGLKFEVKEELFNWKLLQALGGEVGKRTPGGVKRIRYLKEPTETLARLTEIRTKGTGQTISTLLGKDIKALKQLESIYKPEFLDELIRDYWAITPIGLGFEALDDDVYKDLK